MEVKQRKKFLLDLLERNTEKYRLSIEMELELIRCKAPFKELQEANKVMNHWLERIECVENAILDFEEEYNLSDELVKS